VDKKLNAGKMDIAFIDPREPISWPKDGEVIEGLKVIGAIEFKRALTKPDKQMSSAFQSDLSRLKRLGARNPDSFFGMLIVPYTFPWSEDPDLRKQARFLKQICASKSLGDRPNISLVVANYTPNRVIPYIHPFHGEEGFKDALNFQ